MPDGRKQPRRATAGDSLPPVDAGQYLIPILFEVGPAVPVGMGGMSGISELDIMAWQANRGIRLRAWEVEMIRRLSYAYAGQLHEAREPNCAPPWRDPSVISDEHRKKISNAMSDWAKRINAKHKS